MKFHGSLVNGAFVMTSAMMIRARRAEPESRKRVGSVVGIVNAAAREVPGESQRLGGTGE